MGKYPYTFTVTEPCVWGVSEGSEKIVKAISPQRWTVDYYQIGIYGVPVWRWSTSFDLRKRQRKVVYQNSWQSRYEELPAGAYWERKPPDPPQGYSCAYRGKIHIWS